METLVPTHIKVPVSLKLAILDVIHSQVGTTPTNISEYIRQAIAEDIRDCYPEIARKYDISPEKMATDKGPKRPMEVIGRKM